MRTLAATRVGPARSQAMAWGVFLAVAATLLAGAQSADGQARVAAPSSSYGLPLTFEVNRGQTSSQVKFLSRAPGYTAFFTAGGIVLSLRPNAVVPSPASQTQGAATVQLSLVGAEKFPIIVGEDRQPGSVNYFFGSDPTKWLTDVPIFAKVRYKNVYPGIDLLYYGNHRQLQYEFELQPGADSHQIRFEIRGARQIDLDSEGNLVLKLENAEIHFQTPTIYQQSHGQRLPIEGAYVVTDATHIAFQVAHYDSSKPSVIDPDASPSRREAPQRRRDPVPEVAVNGTILVYATYLGGSGINQPTAMALDSTGCVYVTGYTNSTDFPLATLGTLPSNAYHVFLAKLDAAGSNLIYADYIGGNGEDYGVGLVLDSSNDVFVTGSTTSSNFPVVNAYQSQQPGPYTGYLTQVSADGSSLLYSTYLGGSTFDQPASIGIDNLGEVYVAGYTASQNFPVANAYQTTMSANQGGTYGDYGFLTKFSTNGSSLVYSTYLGGNSVVEQTCSSGPCWPAPYNAVNALVVDASGNAYVAGTTNSNNFPTTSGTYLTTNSTQQDAEIGFTSKFTSAGGLGYSTYFYQSSGNPLGITAIAVDSSGSAYITGNADSDGTFPITSASICDPSVSGFACGYAFVTKFDPIAATLLYSTFLGPNNYAFPQAIALDASDDAYVVSSTSSPSFLTSNAIEPYTNETDVLLVEIDPAATTQLSSTYLGGSENDAPVGIALDAYNSIYITGSTSSTDFPFTPGAFQGELAGSMDVFLAKIGAGTAPTIALNPAAVQYPAQQVGTTSQPQQVELRNMSTLPLTISSISVTGDFGETDSCVGSLPPAGNCTLSVTFTPTADGSLTGSVLINDTAVASPQQISLEGTGFGGATVVFTPVSLTFPSTQVGVSSAAQTVTLSNQGNAALDISTTQVTGNFTQTNNCGAVVAAGSSCTFSIVFTPAAEGNLTGALTITDNASGSPQSVSLSGTGLSVTAQLTPTSLAFPSTQVGVSSTAQKATLSNQGNEALNIGSIQITGNFSQTNNCGAVVAAGSSCTFSIVFTPAAEGSLTGGLTISDNAGGSPQSVSLSGTGLSAIAQLTPTSLTFPSTQVGVSSAAQTVTLSNQGNAALNISTIQVTGNFSQTNNCGAVVAAGSSCTFSIVFTPAAEGSLTGALTITDNAIGSPQSEVLSGDGSDFSLASSPVSATVQPGATATYTVTVSPVGGAFNNVVQLTCSGAPAQSTCSVSPQSATPGWHPATVTVAVSTTGATVAAMHHDHLGKRPAYAIWIEFPGFGILGVVLLGAKKTKRGTQRLVVLALMVMLVLMTACAGGTGIAPQTGTPAGTYTITLTGTAGSRQHSLALTLTVQ